MLVCLISVPMFAIFGKDLPDVVKGLLEGRKLVLAPAAADSEKKLEPSKSPEPENPFGQSVPYRAEIDRAGPPREGYPQEIPPLASAPPPAAASPASSVPAYTPAVATAEMPRDWHNAPAPATQPAVFDAPIGGQPLANRDFPGYQPTPDRPPASPSVPDTRMPSGLNPTTGQPVDHFATTPPPASPSRPPADASRDERFRWAEMRLRDLGATHYMLETWGPDNRQYRFGCKMGLPGSTIATQYFEAIKDDPWQAMESVLQQVEQWQAAGSEKTANFSPRVSY